MRNVTILALVVVVLGVAGGAQAQCDQPNSLLTEDQCGFDTPASIGPDSWRAIPQLYSWDPNYGTVEHQATGGHTSPGALWADGAENIDPFGNFYVGGADICIPHVTEPGDIIEFNAWAKVSADPANLWNCNVNITTTNATCDAGYDYLNHTFMPAAADTWTELNPAGVKLEVATGAQAINYNINCWGDADVNITLDDAFIGMYIEPRRYVVTATGVVEWNQVSAPPLGNASVGDPVEMRFEVVSTDYVDGAVYATRGYVIDQDSFQLRLGDGVVGLQDPFPAGLLPYFTIRNDDPGVDGFMLLLDPDAAWPTGIYLDQEGIFGNFTNNFYVTYEATALSSLDIADAVGVWAFDQLTVYNWTVDDDSFNAIGINFLQMEILDGVIFGDDFESGDLGAWTSSSGE